MSYRTRQVQETAEKNGVDRTAGPAFPSARYFQIRFEYLHEVLTDLKGRLDEANAQIVALHARLDLLDEKAHTEESNEIQPVQ